MDSGNLQELISLAGRLLKPKVRGSASRHINTSHVKYAEMGMCVDTKVYLRMEGDEDT